ncbi:ABC transporter permease [Planctomycetota bacterium]
MGLFKWIFAIRKPTGLTARLLLAVLFSVVVFVFWVMATDNPRWLNRAIVLCSSRYELKAGDEILFSVDVAHAQLNVAKAATGRTVVRGLPPIAADALPAFSPEQYTRLFHQLEADGLGRFERLDPLSFKGHAVDATRLAERHRDLGPRPYQLPLEQGEPVDIEIDFVTGNAKFTLDRVPRGGARAKITIPKDAEGRPPRLADFPELPKIVTTIGLEKLKVHPDKESKKKAFIAFVGDADLARKSGLGPRRPIAPLGENEEVLIAFKPNAERPAEHTVELSVERTGKSSSIPFSSSLLAPEAIPSLDSSAYPALPAVARDLGVELKDAGASQGAAALSGQVVDVDRARTSGLGLEKPVELRFVPRSTVPSPTEVLTSLPVLWTERSLLESTGITVLRILKGFGWALLVCLPLGLLMGAFIRVGAFFDPLKLTGMYVPLPALVPLTIAWLGTGEPRITLFLAICTGVVLLPFVVTSVQGVPQVYVDTARTLGATRGQIFRYVLTAISWPTLFKGMKLSFAVGWTWIMLAETIGVTSGLGYIINTSRRRGYIEHVYVVIALVIVMAFVCNALWNLIIRICFRYEKR